MGPKVYAIEWGRISPDSIRAWSLFEARGYQRQRFTEDEVTREMEKLRDGGWAGIDFEVHLSPIEDPHDPYRDDGICMSAWLDGQRDFGDIWCRGEDE